MDGPWRPWDDDEHDDVEGHFGGSGLEAFDDFVPDLAEGAEQELTSPLYTVTNPPGTVSVTVYLNGRIHNVELAPAVAQMTERELAEEVRVIAELARQRARSELHAFLIEGVRMMGDDPAAMRDSLIRELDMPTPEQAAATAARVFSTRYSSDPEGDR
ncbi:YbaB/EbfC family DNA-binding protein [Mycobacterium sp. B14F4]|uniref:YbaB/EbfC family DNA-binding protein n=1 Tax=Mycobacterium sp. B14F4 TaxID=3153565 RepID=UPI00325EB276